ncbi:MAG: transcriptional regulator, TetR family protein [Paenibacillus sp.]|nr:transcriptional regulator, TetR family protein [Paenibacillus sp.]
MFIITTGIYFPSLRGIDMSDTPSFPKPDRRVAKSKQALKQALLSLLVEKDFQSVSITEIVRLADCNRGTFYAHYEHKDALLADVLGDVTSGLIEAFRAPYRDKEFFHLDELPYTAVALFGHVYLHAELYKTMLNANVLPNFREQLFHALKSVALDDLYVDPNEASSRINKELQIIYQTQALLGLTFHWIQEGFKYTPDYMAEQLMLILNWRPGKVIMKHGRKP